MFYKVNVRRGMTRNSECGSLLEMDLRGTDVSKYVSIDKVIVEKKLFSVKEVFTGYPYEVCSKNKLKSGTVACYGDFIFDDEFCDSNIATLEEVKKYIDEFDMEDRSFRERWLLEEKKMEQRQIKKYLRKTKYTGK